MKTRSPLTDEERERAKTLHASGKSVYSVAKTLGRSPHTLAKFLRSPERRQASEYRARRVGRHVRRDSQTSAGRRVR